MPKIDPRQTFSSKRWVDRVGRTLTVVLHTDINVFVVDARDIHVQSSVALVRADVHLTVAMSEGEGQHSAFRFEPQKIKMAVASVAISSYHFRETGTVALARIRKR
jgi:hypothetical protein